MKVDVKVLAILNIFLSLMAIALIIYFGQSSLSTASSREEPVVMPMMGSNATDRGSNVTYAVATRGTNNSTMVPTATAEPDTRDQAQANGPPAGWKPPSDMKPPGGAQQGSTSQNGMDSGTVLTSGSSTPSSSKITSGQVPAGGTPPLGAGVDKPSTSGINVPSSSGGQGLTSNSGSSNGGLLGGLSSPSQSSSFGPSLYDYVSSMRPTIQPLFQGQ